MKLRDDIDIANTWVVSDTHFGHDNIVGYCLRPEDHEVAMLAEWRAEVPDDATVLHLGDLCWKGNAYFKHIIAKELTGSRKLLIKGNHDRARDKLYKQAGFRLARPFALKLAETYSGLRVSEFGTYTVSFSHYPWSEEDDGTMFGTDWRIHGHIHNSGYTDKSRPYVPYLKNHINMSVEQTHYRPVNLKLLLDAALLGRLPA